MKLIYVLIISCFIFIMGYLIGNYDSSIYQYDNNKNQYKGCVPDSITAIKIAQTVLLPKYGSDLFDKYYSAHLINDSVWLVYGYPKDENMLGGDFSLKIIRQNCRVFNIRFGK